MRIFVASWFFPPATSSEGLVTYKLLRNSNLEYDVFSSTSRQWGYKAKTGFNKEENIHSYTIETDSIEKWVDACIEKFEELNKLYAYECIMTRSTPPESILVGKAIKERYPKIKWIASFGDPVANNPYELKAYVTDSIKIDSFEKAEVLASLRQDNGKINKNWKCATDKGVSLLFELKSWEDYALKNADLIIAPSETQLKYILGNDTWLPKYQVIPHSYDSSFYKHNSICNKNKKITFLFTGYSDQLRSLKPFVDAVRQLKRKNSPALDKIHINIVGNTPRNLMDSVINAYLEDIITFSDGVDYYTSLEQIENADWLLHVDAFFSDITSGGSLFFAGKLADYFGTDKPVFALTGEGSPAYRMVNIAGGICDLPWDIDSICDHLEQIAFGTCRPEINQQYRKQFDAVAVANIFDNRVLEMCLKKSPNKREAYPIIENSEEPKLLSICVPSYNAQEFLDRCVYSLINHPMAAYEEVLIINDGSRDYTAEIAEEYARRYPGIVRLINKENGGHGSTINSAIKEAKGIYFKNVDSDDWVDSKNLAKLIENIQNKTITADVISSDYDEINLMTGTNTPLCAGGSIQYGKNYSFETIDPEDCYFTIHSLTIKTNILKSMGMQLQENTFFVDCEYILFPVPYIHSFVFSKDKIYKYSRGNPEQSVDISNMVRRYDHHDRVMRRVIEYSTTSEMSSAAKQYYDNTLHRLLYTHYLLSLFYDKDRERGCARAVDFDVFLKKARPDLYEWTNNHYKFVKISRDSGFSPNIQIPFSSVSMEKVMPQAKKSIIIRASKKMKRIFEKIKNI